MSLREYWVIRRTTSAHVTYFQGFDIDDAPDFRFPRGALTAGQMFDDRAKAHRMCAELRANESTWALTPAKFTVVHVTVTKR